MGASGWEVSLEEMLLACDRAAPDDRYGGWDTRFVLRTGSCHPRSPRRDGYNTVVFHALTPFLSRGFAVIQRVVGLNSGLK